MSNLQFWTEERTARLKSLWAGNVKFGRVCSELGITRGALSGKVHRLGLEKRREATHAKSPAPRIRGQRRRSANYTIKGHGQSKPADFSFNLQAQMFAEVPDFLGIDFAQLKNGVCHYPRGFESPYIYCGQPTKDESSYCPFHHSVCYEPNTAMRPRDQKKLKRYFERVA